MPTPSTPDSRLPEKLEALYRRFNRRRYVRPDPLEFVWEYDDPADREVAGLIASALAYGRVATIKENVAKVLSILGDRPAEALANARGGELRRKLEGFRHRFASGSAVADLLEGAREMIRSAGSLQAAFLEGCGPDDADVLPALEKFCLRLVSRGQPGHLVPIPSRGSACKRMHLFLRWMVRRDAVDPGGWDAVSPASLLVPLDVHMHRICTRLGLTQRKTADLRAAQEVTAAFAQWIPDDPVRYDFVLTRFGIRGDMDLEGFLG
jgi:uncharacterized protein (TIGR02757 family)